MPAAYPSAVNTFVPSPQATKNLIVDFARNLDDFAVNKYTQFVKVSKRAGLYLKMTVEEAGRLLDANLADHAWEDGMPAPEGNDGAESFEWLPYRCKRRTYPVLLGDQAIDQADWNILARHASIKARKAMTARTQLAINALTNAANYPATHTIATSSVPGATGRWDQSTTARSDIKRSIIYGTEAILDSTLAGFDADSLLLVISSRLAGDIAMSQEIIDYIKGSPDALAQVKGELSGQNPNSAYGLPAKLYGVNLVVEKTRKVTSKKGATDARSQILPHTSAFLCTQPGWMKDESGVEGAPSFSTCMIFGYETMSVETMRDQNNRRTIARVTEDIAVVMTAPVTGFLFTVTSA